MQSYPMGANLHSFLCVGGSDRNGHYAGTAGQEFFGIYVGQRG